MDSESESSYDEGPSERISGARSPDVQPDPTIYKDAAQVDGDSSYEESSQSGSEAESVERRADEDNPAQRLSRKRSSRPAEDVAFRPFKRKKGTFTVEYLDLLNNCVEDAAHGVCSDDVELAESQMGLTIWSAVEKTQFFEALSRLGRYNMAAIAARIGTKNELEVQHYMSVIEETKARRAAMNRRSFLESAEYPAAVELSQQCCHAQEEVADAISLRQEQREEQRERAKWRQHWDVTLGMARKLTRKDVDADEGSRGAEDAPKFAHLFHTHNWLNLSNRIFMNSSVPGNNWRAVNDKPPSIWATAFDDFYSLAVSVTRRLVQTTLFISMSRIRAKRELQSSTRQIVRRKDVEAAVASLGMAPNGFQYWKKAARRLRLDVYEEPPDRDEDEADQEPMAYDEVEAMLAGESNEQETSSDNGYIKLGPLSMDEDILDDDEMDDDDEHAKTDNDSPVQDDTDDEEQEEISREAKEVLWYAAAGLRDVQSERHALERRIAMERHQEAQAQLHDEYASAIAEADMWRVLQVQPPADMPRPLDPGPVQRSNMDVESIYPIGRDWSSRLEYYAEWETLDTKTDS